MNTGKAVVTIEYTLDKKEPKVVKFKEPNLLGGLNKCLDEIDKQKIPLSELRTLIVTIGEEDQTS